MERILNWLIKKLVTFYYRKYPFYAWSWGVDENVDLHVISEESTLKSHRYGTRTEVYKNESC